MTNGPRTAEITQWSRVWISRAEILGLMLVLIQLVISGCTVVTLASADKGADAGGIQPGVVKAEAEATLGKPVAQWTSPTGITYFTYQYDLGRTPNYRDAATVAFMDVLSLGLVEFFALFRPIVDVDRCNRTTGRVVIAYDRQDNIIGIFDEFDELPSNGRSGPYRWQR